LTWTKNFCGKSNKWVYYKNWSIFRRRHLTDLIIFLENKNPLKRVPNKCIDLNRYLIFTSVSHFHWIVSSMNCELITGRVCPKNLLRTLSGSDIQSIGIYSKTLQMYDIFGRNKVFRFIWFSYRHSPNVILVFEYFFIAVSNITLVVKFVSGKYFTKTHDLHRRYRTYQLWQCENPCGILW